MAVQLRPPEKPLNSFKRELQRILDQAGLTRHRMPGYRRMGRYRLGDMNRRTPWLVDAWITKRKLMLADQ